MRAEVAIFSSAAVRITHEDLISAVASLPGARPNDVTLSLVMIEYINTPLSSLNVTSEFTAPTTMDSTLPFSIFLALVLISHPP
uniref:Uncharacterized protein n=1 Tax=Candidatus Nitrotoga fabula TaxID=2182327 RepID=A0A2X0QYT1_9PROT|nr:protein of unknown function [Candidatus Nitrotoga fabula]